MSLDTPHIREFVCVCVCPNCFFDLKISFRIVVTKQYLRGRGGKMEMEIETPIFLFFSDNFNMVFWEFFFFFSFFFVVKPT